MRVSQIDGSITLLLEDRTELTSDELQQAYEYLTNQPDVDGHGLLKIARDNAIDWPRGKNSLRLVLIRLYGLMHGRAPDDLTPAPAWYGLVSRTMIEFMKERGHDAERFLRMAQADAMQKLQDLRNRRSREEALGAMSEYWKEIKDTMPPTSAKELGKNRESIIADLMRGVSPQEAFSLHL